MKATKWETNLWGTKSKFRFNTENDLSDSSTNDLIWKTQESLANLEIAKNNLFKYFILINSSNWEVYAKEFFFCYFNSRSFSSAIILNFL